MTLRTAAVASMLLIGASALGGVCGDPEQVTRSGVAETPTQTAAQPTATPSAGPDLTGVGLKQADLPHYLSLGPLFEGDTSAEPAFLSTGIIQFAASGATTFPIAGDGSWRTEQASSTVITFASREALDLVYADFANDEPVILVLRPFDDESAGPVYGDTVCEDLDASGLGPEAQAERCSTPVDVPSPRASDGSLPRYWVVSDSYVIIVGLTIVSIGATANSDRPGALPGDVDLRAAAVRSYEALAAQE